MAKIRGPLMSFSAHGTIARRVTYRQTKGGAVAQLPPIPRAAPSAAQISERARFAVALHSWDTLDPSEKDKWTAAAIRAKLSAVALYTREHIIQRTSENCTQPLYDPEAECEERDENGIWIVVPCPPQAVIICHPLIPA